MGSVYHSLAREEIWLGHYSQGVAYSRQAVTLLEGTTELYELGVALFELGSNCIYTGDFAEALDAAARADTIALEIGDRRLQTYAAIVTASVYVQQGKSEDGITMFQGGLERAPDPHLSATVQGFLGNAYLEQGDSAQAIPCLEQAVQHLRQFRHSQNEGRFCIYLSEAHLMQGDLKQARTLALQGLSLSRESQFEHGIGLAQRALGRIALAGGAHVQAGTHLYAALQRFAETKQRYRVAQLHLDLAALAHVQGNPEVASIHLTEAHDVFETLQVPAYVDRTQQLANALGVSLSPGD